MSKSSKQKSSPSDSADTEKKTPEIVNRSRTDVCQSTDLLLENSFLDSEATIKTVDRLTNIASRATSH